MGIKKVFGVLADIERIIYYIIFFVVGIFLMVYGVIESNVWLIVVGAGALVIFPLVTFVIIKSYKRSKQKKQQKTPE